MDEGIKFALRPTTDTRVALQTSNPWSPFQELRGVHRRERHRAISRGGALALPPSTPPPSPGLKAASSLVALIRPGGQVAISIPRSGPAWDKISLEEKKALDAREAAKSPRILLWRLIPPSLPPSLPRQDEHCEGLKAQAADHVQDLWADAKARGDRA
jgi:hypothetical protein